MKFYSGDMWQLPPIYDNFVMDKCTIDGRLDCAPSHWKKNFSIYYLTEKMRSIEDPAFSALCDRVARGKINEDDKSYLKSRIKDTKSETNNENFKNGNILYIVTTNKKRNFVNNKKMNELLPNAREFVCNSIDNVKNLPAERNLPSNVNDNPAKTGNLLNILKIRIGVPIVVTCNHSKKKYREDGIMNGARGFVQAVQVSKEDPDKVEVIWVVFHDENIGKLYRFEHRHLLKGFYPGHKLATPILPQRKNFTLKMGNVEYQRSNFPLSLAYAITAHKCQGETLNEVIIDFGSDKENNIKNYICGGSFYVALTRVKEGAKVFLKSFDESYIKVDERIEEKIAAMRLHNEYEFKKVFLNDPVFNYEEKEIKVGYLNINGLMDGKHAEYLNCDKNLLHLDILVLSETKLEITTETNIVKEKLSNWKVAARFDSDEGKKNMGLILLLNKNSKKSNNAHRVSHQKLYRNSVLQAQVMIVTIFNMEQYGFIYCRSTPNSNELKAIDQLFSSCSIILGDLNLSYRNSEEFSKIKKLCASKKYLC